MAKYLNKDKKKPGGKILVIVLVLAAVAALAAAYVVFLHPGSKPEAGDGTGPAQTQTMTEHTAETGTGSVTGQETQPATTLPALEYPLVLEDGKLEIINLFQYEGMNPDCNLEEGRSVASITLKNTSGAYLEEARIALTLVDGTVLNFTVMDLPAGKTALAFETANTAAEENARCAEAVCTASWADGIDAMPGDIAVSVEGVAVTVTNNTGRNIAELVISCRCPLGEEYFGGAAYQYTINGLSANESTTVEALDCVLGIAEVVRVAEKQE